MTVHVRELGPDDLDAVAAIETAANPQPWSRRMFAEELALPPASRYWLVAEALATCSAGTATTLARPPAILGFAGMMFAPDAAHLMLVAVDPVAARRRIATRLCLALFADARRRGTIGVTLEVRASNTAAVALYELLGMEIRGSRSRYYPDGEDALLFWIDDLSAPEIETLHQGLAEMVVK